MSLIFILKKVKDFPFDTQCCEINFYSWAHSSAQLKVEQFENKSQINLTHLIDSTEWHIFDTCATTVLQKITDELDWWTTKYILHIERQSIYHFYTLLMPCGGKYFNYLTISTIIFRENLLYLFLIILYYLKKEW